MKQKKQKIKATMRIVNKKSVKDTPGAIKGQTVRPLCGSKQFPSERIRVGHAKFGPNLHEHLHWHAIEVFYYVMAGSAIVRDYHGKEFPVHAGSSIYAPAGIAGSHEWEVGKDGLQLLSIRATTDGHRRMQYTVDRETKRSFIELDELAVMDGISYKSHY